MRTTNLARRSALSYPNIESLYFIFSIFLAFLYPCSQNQSPSTHALPKGVQRSELVRQVDDAAITTILNSASSGEAVLTLLGDCTNATPRVLTTAFQRLAKLNHAGRWRDNYGNLCSCYHMFLVALILFLSFSTDFRNLYLFFSILFKIGLVT
jgi:hypothetical protein